MHVFPAEINKDIIIGLNFEQKFIVFSLRAPLRHSSDWVYAFLSEFELFERLDSTVPRNL